MVAGPTGTSRWCARVEHRSLTRIPRLPQHRHERNAPLSWAFLSLASAPLRRQDRFQRADYLLKLNLRPGRERFLRLLD